MELPPELNDVVVQLRELTDRGTVTVAPVAEAVKASPAAEEPIALAIPIDAVVAALVRVTVATASTPLEIVLAFMPDAMHTYAAAPPWQETVLPAAVAAAPAATLMLATPADG